MASTALLLALTAAAQSQGPVPTRMVGELVAIPRAAYLAAMDTEFRKMDLNGNNVVAKNEIEASLKTAASAQAQARNRAAFAKLDADKNGQLDQAEFSRLQPPATPPDPGPILALADFNKDQSISLIEYRTAKLANFDRMDTDKDMVVTVAEMRAAGLIK